MLLNSRARIDSLLYSSYENNDLRKLLFFKANNDGTVGFKGSYSKSSFICTSICTDELYLMRAECRIRSGNIAEGISDLNTLLIKRWKKNTYIPVEQSLEKDTALLLVLSERRKELLMRGLRWMDIKRLNKEGFDIGLTRVYNGSTYRLDAGSPRFAIPIPDEIIRLSGMKQNLY